MTHSKTVPVRALAWLLMLVMLVSMMPGVPLVAQAADGGTEGMITIEMTDSYGDGWNDNAIEIYVNGELLDTATIDSGSSNTWTKEFKPHETYIFKWVNGRYANETSFVIYVGTEEKLSASGSSYNDGDELLTVPATCTEPVYENGVCTSCGAACLHQMNNGVCGICGYQCPGHSFSDGACVNCGEHCRHSATVGGVCSLCSQEVNLTLELIEEYSDGWTDNAIKVYADGELLDTLTVEAGLKNKTWSTPFDSYTEFTFEWVKGRFADECSFDIFVGSEKKYAADNDICGNLTAGVFFTISSICAHESYDEDFKCTTCRKLCRHKAWTDSVCDACGYTCGTDAEHDWDLGTCKVCSVTCNHSFTDYVCDICGLICGTDVKHSFGEDLECDVCGFVCGTDSNHVWSKGVCTVCASVCPHESYEAGLCTNCGYYEPAVQNGVGANGFALYEIYNANQLLWFADYVNSGEILKTHTFFYDYVWTDVHYTTGCVNGKLMADIDMTGLPWNPIGVEDIEYNGYTGVFDGNAHTVSGINYAVTTEGAAHASFFGLFHGTVKNLTVRGSFKAVTTGEYTAAYAGGIAASAKDAKYACGDDDNFWYEYVYPTIENCTFIGTVSAEANNQAHAGGIAGYIYKGTMTNCLAAATVTVNECRHPYAGALVGRSQESAYTNCYYDSTLCALNACVDGALEGVTGVSTKVMASGAVAYALGFGQTLGTDPYPTYGDDVVYIATSGCVTYTNTACEIVEKAHVGTATCTKAAVCEDCSESFGEPLSHGKFGTDGKCTVCGEYDVPKQNGVGANGFALYEIENASQLLWFANYVNSGEILKTHDVHDDIGVSYTYYTTGCVNAKLIADIDMTGLPWNPIGVRDLQNRGYTGVFDGNGHTVSGIDCTVTSDDSVYAGFFGHFHGTVKNLTVQGSFKAVTTGEDTAAYAGGIVAEAIRVSYTVGFSGMGGIYDDVYPVIENCAFIGTVSAEANYLTYAGGIAGYVSQGTMNNCLSAATVTSNECSYPYAGALVGSDNGSTYTNCYYDSTICSLDACGDEEITGVTGVSTKAMASGAVAYKLGFGQTLGTDAYPTYGDDPVYPVTTGCVTYSNTQEEVTEKAHVGTATCTAAAVCEECGESFGEALGHSELIAATCKDKAVCGVCGESYGEFADHQEFGTDCKCTLCGEYDVPEQNGTGDNGFALYEIESASQLLWFANYVNSGETLKTHTYYSPDGSRFTYYTTNCVNAKLMADIDMTGLPWIPIGVGVMKDGVFISNGFSGVFDGNGHTVSGIDCTATSDDFVYAGFFGHFSGTVKNLNVQGSFKAVTTAQYKSAYVGGIAAYCAYSSFVVSYGNYDYVYPVIENCSFIGTVSVESSSGILAGGIAGYFMTGTMTNCLVAATVSFNEDVYVSAGALVGGDDRSTYTNCYYDSTLCVLDACGNEEITGVTGLATADFADGAVAYALGFGQTLGTDAYPTCGDDQVFQVLNCKEETAYSNTDSNIGHTWATIDCETPITCSTCGATDGDAKGHDWKDATCAAPKTCSNCGATEGYPDYDNHAGEITVVFDWNDPYEGECYVNAYLHCGLCETNISSTSGYGLLTGTVEATDCLNPGSETYEITVELEGQTYTDTHTFVILSENHVGEPVNGFCSACNGYQAAVWNEEKSVYEISNAGQLYWYAQYLNTTNAEIYAELVADIIIPENAPNWEPINASYAYFNGNYHTISGLKCIGDENMTYVGLFGCEGWWYEISNLHIENSYFEGKEYVGAVVACMTNGGSITNCAVTNTMVTSDGDYAGTLAGYLSVGSVINCYVDTDTLVGGYSNGYVTIENSYYLSDTETEDGGKTAAQFASGEVAYLLQSGIAEEDIYDEDWNWIGSYIPEIWGQTIGEDAYPVLGGDKVYQTLNCKGETVYSNTEINGAHMWLDATCTESKTCSVCGETEGEALGHDWKAATCTAPKTCLNCGALEGDVDSDNHASTDYIYQYYRNGYFEKHEKFHACCSASVGMENHSYNEQTGLCNQCGAEILIVVEMVNAPTEYLIHVEYALRRGGRSATLLKDYTNTKSYTVAVDELFFAEGVTLTNNGTLVMPEGFDLSTLENNYNGTGVVTIGDASYVWNGEKFVCAGDHSWQDATCTTPKTCDLCKETEGKALGHNYGNDEACDRCGKFGWIDLLVESYIVEGAENVTVNSDGSWTVTGNITLLPNVTFDYYVFAWLAQTLTADAEVSITVLDMDPNGLYGTNWITLYSLWGDSNAYPAGIHDRIDSIKDVYDFNVEYSGWGNTGTATFRAIYIEPVGTVTLNTLELRTSGCKHSYELIDSSAATCTGNGTATYSCAICGDSYTETIPATGKHVDGDNSGRCDSCGILMQPAKLRMVSISLKGNIALNYYMLLSDEVLADSTAYMQFTMADGEVIQLPVSQGVKHEYYGETYYVFSCEVNAKEMTDDVVSRFFYEGGSTEVHSYSVQTYAKSILATSDNEDVKELVKAMLNYGAASQTHFGYNTDNMANTELEEPDYSGVTISGFNTGAGQGTELAKFYSASLILKSETTLRFFFTAPITATYNGQALEVKERGGLYYVDVVGIAARNLDEDVTITINDGVSTAEVTYNPMAYCAAVLDDTTGAYDQQMKDLVVALYLYNQAANVYLEEN